MGAESWTESAVENLKRMVEAGLSAGQIAVELNGGFSRNAVIGKMLRLGLKSKGARSSQGGHPAAARRPVSRAPISLPAAPLVVSETLADEAISAVADEPFDDAVDPALASRSILEVMVDLEPQDCLWPIGDPRKPGFRYCCRPRADGKPYCAHHVRVAIDPNRKH